MAGATQFFNPFSDQFNVQQAMAPPNIPTPAVSPVPQPHATVQQSTGQAVQAGQAAYSQLPGYAGDIKKIGANIGSELSGQLPGDVVNQIATAGAERGISTGSPGSPNSNASYLQSLGLNSLQMQQTGEQNLSSTLAQLPGGAISQNPGFYVNPALQQQAATTNANAQTGVNESMAGLAAAKAGASAGGGYLNSGPLPPTPNTTAAPTPGSGNSDMSAINAILRAYGETVAPGSTSPGGSMEDIPTGNTYGNTTYADEQNTDGAYAGAGGYDPSYSPGDYFGQ